MFSRITCQSVYIKIKTVLLIAQGPIKGIGSKTTKIVAKTLITYTQFHRCTGMLQTIKLSIGFELFRAKIILHLVHPIDF